MSIDEATNEIVGSVPYSMGTDEEFELRMSIMKVLQEHTWSAIAQVIDQVFAQHGVGIG